MTLCNRHSWLAAKHEVLLKSFEATGAGRSCLGTGHQADISVFPANCYFQDMKLHLPQVFPELQIFGVLT